MNGNFQELHIFPMNCNDLISIFDEFTIILISLDVTLWLFWVYEGSFGPLLSYAEVTLAFL